MLSTASRKARNPEPRPPGEAAGVDCAAQSNELLLDKTRRGTAPPMVPAGGFTAGPCCTDASSGDASESSTSPVLVVAAPVCCWRPASCHMRCAKPVLSGEWRGGRAGTHRSDGIARGQAPGTRLMPLPTGRGPAGSRGVGSEAASPVRYAARSRSRAEHPGTASPRGPNESSSKLAKRARRFESCASITHSDQRTRDPARPRTLLLRVLPALLRHGVKGG